MAYPRQAEIEVPLLQTIADLGGAARPRDVYPKVAQSFPQLTPDPKHLFNSSLEGNAQACD